ncbi:MAG TPA: trypsin-like serine protease [Thermoanaerobaculia bacterium]|jgi:hypothetical protein
MTTSKKRVLLFVGMLLAGVAIVIWRYALLSQLPQIIGPSTADTFANQAAVDDAAKQIVQAHNIAQRARSDAEFVQLFNRQLDRAAGRLTDATTEATPEYYANARALIDEAADDARAIAHGPQREFHTSILLARETAPTEHADCIAVGTDTDWICSGTLLGPTTVATAGHCVEKAHDNGQLLTRVFIGSRVTMAGRVVPVKKRVPHPNYVHEGAENDLALLLIDPVSEPTVGIAHDTEVDSSRSVREVGFGVTDVSGSTAGIRRLLDVPIASYDCTSSALRSYKCNSNRELVAQPATTQPAGVCYGDSGGPAYVRSGSGWRIAGVTSRPAAGVKQRCGGAAIFVRLDRYEPWIRSVEGVVLHP